MIPLGVLAQHQTAPVGDLTLSFVNYYLSSNNGSTWTFTGVPIGSPSPTRRVIIAAGSRSSDFPVLFDSVTIGGVSASMDAVMSVASNDTSAIGSAIVAAGTTADITVTTTAFAQRAGIGVWVIDGAVLADASNGIGSATVDVPAGAVVISAAAGYPNTTPVEWSGVAHRFTDRVEGVLPFSGADAAFSSAQTVTATPIGWTNARTVAAAYQGA